VILRWPQAWQVNSPVRARFQQRGQVAIAAKEAGASTDLPQPVQRNVRYRRRS